MRVEPHVSENDHEGARTDLPTVVEVEAARDGSPVVNRRPKWMRWLLLTLGVLALALGAAGIFLPLLPTTPFVLLAAFLFARSSERAHGWLLRQRVFGRIVREWQQHRCIPAHAKWTAVGLVFVLAVAFSLLITPSSVYGDVVLFVVGPVLTAFLVRLPTSPRSTNSGE